MKLYHGIKRTTVYRFIQNIVAIANLKVILPHHHYSFHELSIDRWTRRESKDNSVDGVLITSVDED